MIVSRCGVDCSNCERREQYGCGGCTAIKEPVWGSCRVKTCCESKSLLFCGECEYFPCEMLSNMGKAQGYDPKLKLERCRQWRVEQLIGVIKAKEWNRIHTLISSLYDKECVWSGGNNQNGYELRFRRGVKTICTLSAKPAALELLVIFNEAERVRFDNLSDSVSDDTLRIYSIAETYRDGKWVVFDETISDDDIRRVLSVKRRPVKK